MRSCCHRGGRAVCCATQGSTSCAPITCSSSRICCGRCALSSARSRHFRWAGSISCSRESGDPPAHSLAGAGERSMTDTKALLVLLLSALLGRLIAPAPLAGAATRALNARWVPLVLGLVTAVFMTWLWGGLDQVATVHDEAAYLLQAKTYAGGHWTAPGLPLPEFFEQYHVLVTPVLTPKY